MNKEHKKKNKDIDPFIMSIHIIKVDNKPAIQFRKIITFCPKNMDFVNELINASVEDKPIYAPVKIQFNDKLKAIQTLKELGFIVDLKKSLN